jgi:hypothetical protein
MPRTTPTVFWLPCYCWELRQFSKSVFGSVVADAFQITFRAEMHANDVFLFFKNHF